MAETAVSYRPYFHYSSKKKKKNALHTRCSCVSIIIPPPFIVIIYGSFSFSPAETLSLLVYLRRVKAAPDFMVLFSCRLQLFLGHVAVIILLDCRLGWINTFPSELGRPDVGVCLVSCLGVDGVCVWGGALFVKAKRKQQEKDSPGVMARRRCVLLCVHPLASASQY